MPKKLDVKMLVSYDGEVAHDIRFTNVSAELIKTAIDVLNADQKMVVTPTHRTQDFTLMELFEDKLLSGYSYMCKECGAAVFGPDKHVAWHNKLLP